MFRRKRPGGQARVRAAPIRALAPVAAAFSAFHLYNTYSGTIGGLQLAAVHLGFALVLTFMQYPMLGPGSGRWARVPDAVLGALSVLVAAYVFVEYPKLTFRAGLPTRTDIVLGCITVLLVLEATRRVLGPALPLIAIGFIAYAFAGHYAPDLIAHPGYSLDRVAEHLYLTGEGIFGIPVAVSARYIILFIVFGVFLKESGGGQFFISLAQAGFGGFRGGPAKVAIVASTLFGSITGSAVANAGTVGPLTIPVMKRVGFGAQYAAAIEAVASCGSQLMPPVMGASAFLIAEILGIGYLTVALVALLPAILYYAALFAMVDLKAAKEGMRGVQRGEQGAVRQALRDGGHLLIGPLVLILALVVGQVSPARAALWGVLSTIAASWLRPATRMAPRAVWSALTQGGLGAVEVALATACAGIVIGIFTLTGLGMSFSSIIVDLAGGSLLVLLLLTVVASLVLGTGLPTVPTYLLLAILVAPALVEMDIAPMAAHLFIFYFGAIADMTPPLAMSAMVAAGIAGADPFKTTFTASRIGLVGYLIPFMFVFDGAYLLEGTALEIAWAAVTGVLGVVAVAAALEGYLLWRAGLVERGLLLAAAVLLISPGLVSDLTGCAVLAGVLVRQYAVRRQRQAIEVAARAGDAP